MLLFYRVSLFIITGIFLFSCNEDELFTECELVGLTIEENSSKLECIFDKEGVHRLREVSAYMGTDSSFQLLYYYENGQLSKVEEVDTARGIVKRYFDVKYNGPLFIGYREFKYSYSTDSFTKGKELKVVYDQENISVINYYYPNLVGDYYQVEELQFEYTTDSTISIVHYVDIIARVALLIGNDPIVYNPIKLEETIIVHDDSYNPFYGMIIPEINTMYLGLLKNNITQVKNVSRNVVTVNEIFQISYNSLGNFAMGISEKKLITARYRNCL